MDQAREIVALSREFGAGDDWVIGGGGNSSIKDERWMWVKASGTALADIEPHQFVKMDRRKLAAIWDLQYPEEQGAREDRAKADLFAARAPGEESKRPSVEALMHALFPSRIVFHTHPTLVNALTCARQGRSAAQRILGEEQLWIPMINPGYVLARRIYDERLRYLRDHEGREPRFILLENHGLVVHGESSEDIRRAHGDLVDALVPETGGLPPESTPREAPAVLTRAAARLAELRPDLCIEPGADGVLEPFVRDRTSLAPLEGALSPDHIVYAGHRPATAETPAEVPEALSRYQEEEGVPPKTLVLLGSGVLGIGTSVQAARNAVRLFVDAARIAHLAPRFGGMQFMPKDQVEFIRNWEVEKYRQQVSNRRPGS